MASRSLIRPRYLRALAPRPALSFASSPCSHFPSATLRQASTTPNRDPPKSQEQTETEVLAEEAEDQDLQSQTRRARKSIVAAAQKLAHPRPGMHVAETEIDWIRSYHGLAEKPFAKEVAAVLSKPLETADIEVKPDGILYLPEIKYRRILNAAFGPGGWGLVPKGDAVVGERIVTREYALVAEGRFISQAQGENQYFSLEGLPAAVEGCKSNALMRCCKDVGVASELWDPVFLRKFKEKHAEQVWAENVTTKKKRLLWTKKGVPLSYPYKKT